MYADRTQRAKTDPVSLTAAIGINAALVAALLFSNPDIIKTFDPPLKTYPVKDDPAPPPEPQPETAKTLPTDPKIVTPVPKIIPVPSEPTVTTTDLIRPPIPFDPDPSLLPGGGTVTVDPPKPAPVLVDAKPDPRAEFQPDYPASGRREGVEGSVTVRVLVGTDGRVKAVEELKSIGDAFFAATRRQALARWRFTPATRDGVAVESWRTMTVRFELRAG